MLLDTKMSMLKGATFAKNHHFGYASCCKRQEWYNTGCLRKEQQKHTRWAPTSYKRSYNLYKWPYTWVTGVITLLMEVITPFIIDRGPPCIEYLTLCVFWGEHFHEKLGGWVCSFWVRHKYWHGYLTLSVWERITQGPFLNHRIHLVPESHPRFNGCFSWMIPDLY